MKFFAFPHYLQEKIWKLLHYPAHVLPDAPRSVKCPNENYRIIKPADHVKDSANASVTTVNSASRAIYPGEYRALVYRRAAALGYVGIGRIVKDVAAGLAGFLARAPIIKD